MRASLSLREGPGKSTIEPAKSKFLAIPSKKGEMTDVATLKTFIMKLLKKK
jgi:hypothetical protein